MKKKQIKQKIFYDKKSDALWLLVKSGMEEEHKEIAPGVSVELDKNGEILGIEVLNASKVFAQAKSESSPKTSQLPR